MLRRSSLCTLSRCRQYTPRVVRSCLTRFRRLLERGYSSVGDNAVSSQVLLRRKQTPTAVQRACFTIAHIDKRIIFFTLESMVTLSSPSPACRKSLEPPAGSFLIGRRNFCPFTSAINELSGPTLIRRVSLPAPVIICMTPSPNCLGFSLGENLKVVSPCLNSAFFFADEARWR